MRLLADRFVTNSVGPAVDLATGAHVTLRVGASGSPAEQLRWTLRGDRWRALQQRAVARLVDFGLVGERGWFEAWQCGPRWSGDGAEARATCETATQFLHASGMTVGADLLSNIHVGPSGPILLPDEGSGYPNGSHEPVDDVLPLECRALAVIARPAVAALGEMFEHADRCRSRVAVVWGPAGAGKATVVRELARMARINGFVPIASRLLDAPYAELWTGRSLFIIAADGATAAWRAALHSALRSPKPHVVLVVSETEQRGVDGVGLPPLDVDALASAVYPRTEDRVHVRRIRRAAEHARGLPGRFVRLLWRRFDFDPIPDGRQVRLRTGVTALNDRGLVAAESSSVYGGASELVEPTANAARIWPASIELASLRQRAGAAQLLIARGRHGAGVRQLRFTVAALARRHDWGSAAEGGLTLAACLLNRGRPGDAQAVLQEARQHAGQASHESLLVDVATLNGEAWIDMARLDEAESVLAAAATSARALGDPSRIASTAVSLGRCMYWRGQYTEAAAALAEGEDRGSMPVRLRADLLAARLAVAQGQYERATSLTTKALGSARAENDRRAAASALYCAGLVRLAIGDLDLADRDLSDAVVTARAARDPLRAIRARLLQVELERRRGRGAAVAERMERLTRVARTLPALLRTRIDLLRSVIDDPARAAGRAAQQVSATGLGALPVYVGGVDAPTSAGPIEAIAREVIAIVRTCQTADDEAVVLKDLCGRVRHQLHAAAVAFVAGPRQRHAVLSSEGPRIDSGIAERAITAGIVIAPHRAGDRVEAAAPVIYGSAPIGALCARWTLGSPHDLRRAAATLEMAAAAAAPIVSAVLTRRDSALPPGVELLGVTVTMAELRRAIERAATAPFAVLIEGESGSGKELVARAIHRLSARRDRTFCTLNCAALPDDLVEAELFGHSRGAFTGATTERPGVFEEAHGGTLFLDEIGELAQRAQAKVLRVIQDGELRRVGENLPRRVDVRIIAATNRDLRQEVEAGRFRMDLWYRLDVVRITVPPLRDRREDIVVLADHFWREASQRVASRATLGTATVSALARYDWPGNVRELQNVLASLVVRSPKRGVVPPTALPPQFAAGNQSAAAWRFIDARRNFEERFVRAALVRSGGHRGRAATELGVSRQGLTKLMTRLGIVEDDAS